MPSTLAVRAFTKWLRDLPISDAKRTVLTTNIEKTEKWLSRQPAEALETVERVAVMMGIPVNLLGKNYEVLNLLRAMTAAISMTNWLAPQLRRKLKRKVLQSHLQALHSMILLIYILTPFTMSSTLFLFQGFRIIQTRMMVLSVIHGLRPNQKLKAILEGCTYLKHLWGSTLGLHNLFSQPFFQSQSVCIRFTHVMNMQPKFYVGSAVHHTLDREYSRSRKFSQLTNECLIQAELALRYWKEHDNLFAWAPIPLFTERADYRCLELALIQEWQPRLNYPFTCQFFHPRKGLLHKPAMNTNAQFGLATLWRRSKHKFTPQVIKDILASNRFQHRSVWTNQDAPLSWRWAQCYALRRLANNIQEPYRTLSLQAIDSSIQCWEGKPAPRASALRAPWSLSPNIHRSLRQFMRQWHPQVLACQVPCHPPSFKTVFIKHAAVLDQLCNRKQAILECSSDQSAHCCCNRWSTFKHAAVNPTDPHWVLAGSLLHDTLPTDLAVIAEGSLLNKVFPSKKDYLLFFKSKWVSNNGQDEMGDHGSWKSPLATTHPRGHSPYHEILHLKLPISLWWCCFPLQGQTCVLSPHLLPVSLPPSYWKHIPWPINLWNYHTGTCHHCRLSCLLIDKRIRQVIPLGHWQGPSTSFRVHLTQKEGLSKRSTNHFLCWCPFPANPLYLGNYDSSAHPSGLPWPLRYGRCVHSTVNLAFGTDWWTTHPYQPRPGWLLHQHRTGPFHWGMVYAPRLPSTSFECCRQRSVLGLPRKIQQSRRPHQRSNLSKT